MFKDKVTQSVAEAVKKVWAEELKGNQHKIDKNKNGKIDGQDLAILRKEETVEEGWDDMMADVKKRNGPQPNGGSGVKQGTRYGGGKQKPDTPEKDEDSLKSSSQRHRVETAVAGKKKFSEMVNTYEQGGIKELFKEMAIEEEASQEEFNAELEKQKKKASGTATDAEKAEVAKPAVQAVQQEETELNLEDYSLEEIAEFILSEHFEQLDELTKTTLGSYVNKATKDASTSSSASSNWAHTSSNAKNPRVKAAAAKYSDDEAARKQKRLAGVGNAVKRLAKEQTEIQVINADIANGVDSVTIEERSLTDAETAKKEEIVKSMKKGIAGFKERYGKDAKSVMYATATKQAKGE